MQALDAKTDFSLLRFNKKEIGKRGAFLWAGCTKLRKKREKKYKK